MRKSISSFSAGEVSDLIDDRSAIEQVQRGCRTLTNMELGRYGYLDKRAGTDYLGTLKASADWRIEEFEFSAFTKFVLEFGVGYIRFWSNDLQVEVTPSGAWVTATDYVLGDAVTDSGTTYYCIEAHTSGTLATDIVSEYWYALEGNILEIPTDYTVSQLHELQTQPIQDLVYIVHADQPLKVLKRYSDTNWQLEDPALTGPYTEGSEDIKMTASATTGTITITSDTDYFKAGHNTAKMRLFYKVDAQSKNKDLLQLEGEIPAANLSTTSWTTGDEVRLGSSGPRSYFTCIADYSHLPTPTGDYTGSTDPADYPAFFEPGAVLISSTFLVGSWEVFTEVTGANWDGETWVQRSEDEVEWETIAVFVSNDPGNSFTTGDTEEVPVYIRVLCITGNAAEQSDHKLTANSGDIPGTAQITNVTDAKTVTATVTQDFPESGEAKFWELESWNAVDGYPRAIAFEGNRLVYGGTKTQPITKWYSKTDEYDELVGGTLADAAFSITAIGLDSSPIQWLSTHDGAFLGTASGEATVEGRKLEDAVSPENLPNVRWFSNQGNAYLEPSILNSTLFTIQAGRDTLNEFAYSIERGFNGGYDPSEATLLAEHILSGKAKQKTIRREPEKGVWIVKEDGDIAVYTHRPKARMAGWWRIETDGDIKSVAILRGDGTEDEVYWATERNGVGYLEKMRQGNMETRRSAESAATQAEALDLLADLCYLDCATKFTGTAMASVSGLTRFASQEVTYLRDGVGRTGTVDVGGVLTLDKAADLVLVGLPFTATVEPRSVEAFSEFGTSMSRRKQITEIVASYYLSLDGRVRDLSGNWQDVVYTHDDADNPVGGSPLNPKTAAQTMKVAGRTNRKKSIRFEHSSPYPFTLLGLYVELRDQPL